MEDTRDQVTRLAGLFFFSFLLGVLSILLPFS